MHSVQVQVAVFGRHRGRSVDCSANALAACRLALPDCAFLPFPIPHLLCRKTRASNSHSGSPGRSPASLGMISQRSRVLPTETSSSSPLKSAIAWFKPTKAVMSSSVGLCWMVLGIHATLLPPMPIPDGGYFVGSTGFRVGKAVSPGVTMDFLRYSRANEWCRTGAWDRCVPPSNGLARNHRIPLLSV
jgi:hypothetical protein